MPDGTKFRCPFEEQGMEAGIIPEILLGEDRHDRIHSMRDAIARLRRDTSIHSVRFVLPDSVLVGCATLEELRDRILPYQADFLAADIDNRLYPHLSYHPAWQRFKAQFNRSRRYKRYAARALEVALETGGYGVPKHVEDLADKIETLMLDMADAGDPDPICIFGHLKKDGKKYWLFKMERGAFGTYTERCSVLDPEVNDANFSIIKAPLYPEAFGRYSARCELVVTRDIDVLRLSDTVKMRIRSDANHVHMAHGVRINDPSLQQPTGLWIPEWYQTPR